MLEPSPIELDHPMELRFFGATGGTTGTCHMVRAGGSTVLLDCGMFQGRRDESRARNERFGFDPARVDAVVQSHAHVDHSGKLPMLVRHGFQGRIHSTSATRDLCAILLRDSARILLQDAEHLNRARLRKTYLEQRDRARRRALKRADARRKRRGDRSRSSDVNLPGHHPNEAASPASTSNLPAREVRPLFLEEDVDATMPLFTTHDYGTWFDATPNMRFRFHDAGHILGSAWVEGEIQSGRALHRLVFTGDYGRKHQPILRDPEPLLPADVYIAESTYGNRVHPPFENLDHELAAAVLRLAERGRGRLLIPAFAVGRTQNVLYSLARIFREGLAPGVHVVVDSPLATEATRVVLRHPECFDEEALSEYRRLDTDPVLRRWLTFTDSVEASKALNLDPRPMIVLSASGMLESGRILHHVSHHVSREDAEILIVGFQAEHTLGRRLVEGARTVQVLGLAHTVRARVTSLLGFSAHADRNELVAALEPHARTAKVLFLVHGEDDQREPLARALAERGFGAIERPLDARAYRV